jgi:peptide deformylase
VKHVDNYLTHIINPDDFQYLKSKLLDVNMRLFESSRQYRSIVQQCFQYIREVALTEMVGYKKPDGMSGANVGIPFNIIAYVEGHKAIGMINPKITYASEAMDVVRTNCGSIRLPAPIKVKRHFSVEVGWFDEEGDYHTRVFFRGDCGFTIQHEIDHNLGILITDKEKR